VAALAATFGTTALSAQRPVTLEQAIAAAESASPRIAVALADSTLGSARTLTAREWPNPDVALGYSKDPPQYHVELEQPVELPGLRSARAAAARLAADVAVLNLAAERLALRYDVASAYARAAGALAVARLSTSNAADAAQLLDVAQSREAAGDASELDVRLAAVFTGQAASDALGDSLTLMGATLELQALMGLSADSVQITPADSLQVLLVAGPALTPTFASSGASGAPVPLRIAAAERELEATQAELSLARRARIPTPLLRAGFETHDPDDDTGMLPTVGVAIPLPIWSRRRGALAEATATVTRSTAELALVRLESGAALAAAERERELLMRKVERDRGIVADAQEVATLSRTAYAEGAYPLATVLEAQRSARDALRSFVEDLQAFRLAESAVIRAQVVGGTTP
jgi:cobalt-zinc-cadmium efflux system outer membrane protein